MNITTRKRSSSGSKRPKDKIVLIYEQIFMSRETHRNGSSELPDDFQELFTLQPNAEALEAEISKLTNEQVISIKSNIVNFLMRAIESLSSGESSLNLNQFLMQF